METIAKPTHGPQAIPHRIATNSWPKSGGNESTMRMAIGIKNPPGVACAQWTTGAKAFTIFVWNTAVNAMTVIINTMMSQVTREDRKYFTASEYEVKRLTHIPLVELDEFPPVDTPK